MTNAEKIREFVKRIDECSSCWPCGYCQADNVVRGLLAALDMAEPEEANVIAKAMGLEDKPE